MLRATGVSQETANRIQLPDATMTYANGLLDIDMSDESDVNAVIDTLRSSGAAIQFVTPREKLLEDLFIETVGGRTSLDGVRKPEPEKEEVAP